MTQEFVTLPREVVEQALEALKYEKDANNPLDWHHDRTMDALRAALEQPQNHVPDTGNMVPAGCKLVPVEPTKSMVESGLYMMNNSASFLKREMAVEIFQAMINAAPHPPTVKECLTVEQQQANQPAMTPIAQRKLEDLMASGYTISGYSVYHERKHQHGFVTGAGLVGWWKPEGVEYPQPQGDQETRFLADGARYKVTHLTNAGYCIHGLPREMLGQWVAFVDATDNKHMANQQPKREPLTDEQIEAIADAMPGGLEGFMKGWGWMQFARAVLAATHNIK